MSVMTTLDAVSGPLLWAVRVNVIGSPVAAFEVDAVFASERSALAGTEGCGGEAGLMLTSASSLLLPALVSVVVDVTDAVIVAVPGGGRESERQADRRCGGPGCEWAR